MSVKGVRIEDKKIEELKNFFEPKLIWDIQVFFCFSNFYQYFIWGFNKIVGSLTSMLKTGSKTQSAKNFLSNIAQNSEDSDGSEQNERIKLSAYISNLNKTICYLNSDAKKILTQ